MHGPLHTSFEVSCHNHAVHFHCLITLMPPPPKRPTTEEAPALLCATPPPPPPFTAPPPTCSAATVASSSFSSACSSCSDLMRLLYCPCFSGSLTVAASLQGAGAGARRRWLCGLLLREELSVAA